jgi:hypothetical protein
MTTRAIQTIQNGLETTHQDAVSATGNGVAATVNGFGSITFQITGTFTATVTFEASVDGSNYETIAVIDSDGNRVTSATSEGLYRADIAGYKSVRTPVTWTSGTSVTVKSLALPGHRSFDVPVQQSGSKMALSQTPKTGTKTVTSTAAEIFADTSRLSGRSMMYIRNTHDSIAIRIGASNITDVKGRRILPNSEGKIELDPQSDIPLYGISEFGDVEVEVFEA